MARWKSANWTRYHQILNKIADMGHMVYVLQPPPRNSLETNFIEVETTFHENIKVITIPINKGFWDKELPFDKIIKKGVYNLYLTNKLSDIMKIYSINAILLYNIPQILLIRTKSCIKIFDYADDYVSMLKHELGFLSNRFIDKIAEKALHYMFKKADLVTTVSNTLVEHIPSKSVVIPNGVNIPKIFKESNKEIKKKTVGFVGSLEYFIDIDLILECAKELPEINFLIVGGGREFQLMNQYIRKNNLSNIVMTGPVPYQDVMKYIEKMDICLNIFKPINVSHYACPIKLFEYLACNKPVISTSLKEVKLIDKNFLYYADNLDELKKQILYIFDNWEEAVRKVKVAKQLIDEHYTWSNISNKFLQEIQSVAANG